MRSKLKCPNRGRFDKKFNRLYIGYTSNLIERFKDHNQLGKKGFCKRFRPWEVIFVHFFYDQLGARTFEKRLKSGKGREWIRRNILTNYV